LHDQAILRQLAAWYRATLTQSWSLDELSALSSAAPAVPGPTAALRDKRDLGSSPAAVSSLVGTEEVLSAVAQRERADGPRPERLGPALRQQVHARAV